MLLLDGAIRFAEQTKAGYESRDFEAAYSATTKCQAILTELICSLQAKHNPALCERMTALYTYMYKRLVEASIQKTPDIVREVVDLLQYDRETWVLLMQEIKNGNTSVTLPVDGGQGGDAPAPRLSVQA